MSSGKIDVPGTIPTPPFLPWNLINETRPPVATVLKHEAASAGPTRATVRNEL